MIPFIFCVNMVEKQKIRRKKFVHYYRKRGCGWGFYLRIQEKAGGRGTACPSRPPGVRFSGLFNINFLTERLLCITVWLLIILLGERTLRNRSLPVTLIT